MLPREAAVMYSSEGNIRKISIGNLRICFDFFCHINGVFTQSVKCVVHMGVYSEIPLAMLNILRIFQIIRD